MLYTKSVIMCTTLYLVLKLINFMGLILYTIHTNILHCDQSMKNHFKCHFLKNQFKINKFII